MTQMLNFYGTFVAEHPTIKVGEGANSRPHSPRLASAVNLLSTSKNPYEHAHVRVSSEAHTDQKVLI